MKECTHCGGPNAPENRVCDYCGMGFSEDTIPEGSIDPREQAKLDAEAWKEANREKELVEFNLDDKDDQNVAINSSVLARAGTGCGCVGDVTGAWLASAPLSPSLWT